MIKHSASIGTARADVIIVDVAKERKLFDCAPFPDHEDLPKKNDETVYIRSML